MSIQNYITLNVDFVFVRVFIDLQRDSSFYCYCYYFFFHYASLSKRDMHPFEGSAVFFFFDFLILWQCSIYFFNLLLYTSLLAVCGIVFSQPFYFLRSSYSSYFVVNIRAIKWTISSLRHICFVCTNYDWSLNILYFFFEMFVCSCSSRCMLLVDDLKFLRTSIMHYSYHSPCLVWTTVFFFNMINL